MIEKEELEKLIREEATIYIPFGKRGKIKQLKLNNLYAIDDNGVYVRSCCDCKTMCYKWGQLYKTKAEAEWVAKMYATRVERFEPPTWGNRKVYEFYNKTKDFYRILPMINFIYIQKFDYDICDLKDVKEYTLTQENYTKAVEYARRLFLGESDE